MPAVENDVVHTAKPEESVTAEHPLIEAAFEVKPTVPVGDAPPLTDAVNVTD